MNSLADVLEEHLVLNIHAEDLEDMQRITVRRRAIWKDTVRCLSRPDFVYGRGLRVIFLGEEAIDAGGPLR